MRFQIWPYFRAVGNDESQIIRSNAGKYRHLSRRHHGYEWRLIDGSYVLINTGNFEIDGSVTK